MSDTNFNNIKGIIFDLDGTLYCKKWFMRPFMTVGALPQPLLLPKYMKIRKRYADKDMGSGENLLRSIAKEMGDEEKYFAWLTVNFYRVFVNTLKFMRNSRPGLNEILSDIKNKNIKIAVLSDYSKIEERLDILNIDKSLFNIMVSSESEGFLKPGKGPFLKIAKSFDLNPENILVIGDRDDTDGKAAEKSGMPFLKITDKKEGNGSTWDEVKSILSNF